MDRHQNTATTATTVNLDALDVTGTLTQAPSSTPRYQENDAHLRYLGTWTRAYNAGCSGQYQTTTNDLGAVLVTFTGTTVNVIATKGPSYGGLKVTLDGNAANAVIVDLYSATAAYQQKVYAKSGLTNTSHSLRLDWTGLRNTASSGTTVDLDAIEIVGSLTQAPVLTGGLVGFWSTAADYDWVESYTFRTRTAPTRISSTMDIACTGRRGCT